MIEVIKLIKELRGYPENSFAFPQIRSEELKDGLVVVALDGEELGFIEMRDEDTIFAGKG